MFSETAFTRALARSAGVSSAAVSEESVSDADAGAFLLRAAVGETDTLRELGGGEVRGAGFCDGLW